LKKTHEETLNEEDFNDWFRRLLHSTSSCFERDVIRDCKSELKKRYILRAELWPEDPDDN